jgi:serine/threonine-protein kinase RsbT
LWNDPVTTTVLAHYELPITNDEDVVTVRRRVRAIAQERGFDAFASAAVTTATSELARNAWVHAGGGSATIEEITKGGQLGLRVMFRDAGPGIEDIGRVLAGGYSTARSMGLGLSGSKRLVDDFIIESVVGRGTVITFVKWKPL